MSSIGALIMDISGKELLPEEKAHVAHPLVGGIILFARNYESKAQLKALCTAIRKTRTDILILVDQEGGRVQRFKEDFSLLPSMGSLGQLYDTQPDLACQKAIAVGSLMAKELLEVGIDLSLAPVLDININNNVIGDRSFHANPQVIIKLAEALIGGMQQTGMASVVKHFPGHGSVVKDSHVDFPVDERPLEEIEKKDLIPFISFSQKKIPAIMVAHILFSQVDNKIVSYSSIWLQKILRHKIGFDGAIFSDDLNMAGANISDNYSDRFIAAREAGCDFVLVCNNSQQVTNILDNIPSYHQVAKIKWQRLQGRHFI